MRLPKDQALDYQRAHDCRVAITTAFFMDANNTIARASAARSLAGYRAKVGDWTMVHRFDRTSNRRWREGPAVVFLVGGSPEQQHEAMYEAMLRSPSSSQATPLGNRPEIHDPSDKDTKRLKIEVDEMRRFTHNQQDQLLVAIRTATAAAVAGMVEAASPPQRPASTAPATRTDRLHPVIGEAIEKVRKEFTEDVVKFLRAKLRADKSSEELALFDDAKMTLPKGIRPSTSVTTLAELDETIESAKSQQLVSALNILQGSTRRQASEMVYYQWSKFAKQFDNGAPNGKSEKCGDESQEANSPGSIIGSIKRGDHTL